VRGAFRRAESRDDTTAEEQTARDGKDDERTAEYEYDYEYE
jgi:hypothetical protein